MHSSAQPDRRQGGLSRSGQGARQDRRFRQALAGSHPRNKRIHRHARSMRAVSLFRGVHCRIRRATRDARSRGLELRRYCTVDEEPRRLRSRQGFAAPRVRLENGLLEKIVDDAKNPAREPLLWQNGFFGKRERKKIRLRKWFQAHNAPLYLNPQILEEVLKYV